MNSKEGQSIDKKVVDMIEWLGEFGKTPEGGVTRLLYTDAWVKTQSALKKLLEEKGFEAYYDDVGNLFGRLKGNKYTEETILTGSHIDTVVNGGKLDGELGIVGGIIAMEYLREKYGEPLRNIEVVSIAEEEGSRFPFTFWGSKNIVDSVDKEQVASLKDADGIGFVQAMHESGFDFKAKDSKEREDLKSFIELHIEQGGVLEIENKSIGVVEHIVGQRRFTIEVKGEANHAGTTPMGYRRDSLYATSYIIQRIMDRAIEYGDPLVATVGSLEVRPNTVNVVPGSTIFSLDIRHVSKKVLLEFTHEIEEIIDGIAKDKNVEIKMEMFMDEDPVAMDRNLVNIIEEQCVEKGLSYKRMHSGAGHDSQIFATILPTAMIFVPSHKGISHNPAEFTETEDLVEGIKALIETLYYLAYR